MPTTCFLLAKRHDATASPTGRATTSVLLARIREQRRAPAARPRRLPSQDRRHVNHVLLGSHTQTLDARAVAQMHVSHALDTAKERVQISTPVDYLAAAWTRWCSALSAAIQASKSPASVARPSLERTGFDRPGPFRAVPSSAACGYRVLRAPRWPGTPRAPIGPKARPRSAAAARPIDQAFRRELAQRLADRRAAHAQPFGQGVLLKRLARPAARMRTMASRMA